MAPRSSVFGFPCAQNECSCAGYPDSHRKVPGGGAYAADSCVAALPAAAAAADVPWYPPGAVVAAGVQVSGRYPSCASTSCSRSVLYLPVVNEEDDPERPLLPVVPHR